MSDIGVHVTITLNASPLLIDVMMNVVDLLSDPPGSKEPQPHIELEKFMNEQHELKNKKNYTIREIPEFNIELEYLPEINSNLRYGETKDGKLCIRYLSGAIYTTWDQIETAYNLKLIDGLRPIVEGSGGNKQTALNQFMRAIATGLKRKEYSDPVDPDDDFRPHLTSVIDTSTGYDGNKVEGSLDG